MKNLRYYIIASVVLAASALFTTRSVINVSLVAMIDLCDSVDETTEKINYFRIMPLPDFDQSYMRRFLLPFGDRENEIANGVEITSEAINRMDENNGNDGNSVVTTDKVETEQPNESTTANESEGEEDATGGSTNGASETTTSAISSEGVNTDADATEATTKGGEGEITSPNEHSEVDEPGLTTKSESTAATEGTTGRTEEPVATTTVSDENEGTKITDPVTSETAATEPNELEVTSGDITDDGTGEGKEEPAGNYFENLARTKYKWERSTAGYVQSAFFVGYILLQLPAASLADKYGAKKFILICVGGSSIITLITPFIAFVPFVLILSRFIMGLVQSCMFPSCFVILVNWLPAKDRTLGFALLSTASYIGSVILYFTSGFIIQGIGWPYLFWIFGLICGAVSIFSAWFLTSKPEEHRFINEDELNLIKGDETVEMSATQSSGTLNTASTQVTFTNGSESKNSAAKIVPRVKLTSSDTPGNRISTTSVSIDDETFPKVTKTKPPIPWKEIFMNVPFWVTLVFRFIHASMFMLYYNCLPMFLKTILCEEPSINGIMNAAVQLFAGISAITIGSMSERLIERGFMERTRLRKFFGVLCGVGQSICLAFIPIFTAHGCNRTVESLIVASAFFIGFIAGAETPLPAEMSKNFGPTLYAIFNMGAMITGIIVPNVVTMVLSSFDDSATGWYVIFYASAIVMTSSTIPFVIYASAERQPFDMTDDDVFEERFRSPSAVSWRYSVS